jgi:hypothetical protein
MKTFIHWKSALMLISLSGIGFCSIAQSTKDIFEKCETNNDCKSGNCVTLRTGEKKCSKCSQDELNGLTQKVDENCKMWDQGVLGYNDLRNEFGSKNEVSLISLNYRMQACKSCYDARSNREYKCWDGGDAGHKEQLDKLKESMNYLEGLINEKTRNGLGYNCDPEKYQHMVEDINSNCRDIDQLFEKYGHFEEKEGSCRDLEDLIDKCIDCREAWEDLMNNCFRNGASSERVKRFADIKDMEKIAKETLDKRKSKNLCK